MKKRLLYLPFVIILFLSVTGMNSVSADQTSWTEKKLGKYVVRADKAAARKKWSLAIKYGEKILEGSKALSGLNTPDTITRLKNLNRYYDKSGRLKEIPERIKETYFLSKKYFKLTHNTVVTCRLLYYKTLLAQEDYKNAVPLVLESMSILGDSRDDAFKKLHYLGQLHGLYGMSDQPSDQEKTLLELLKLNKKLVGTDIESNMKIIMNLAKSYCLQKKNDEFKELMQTYNLNFEC